MSILTKILTLLVALVAIFLSGVVIVFVGNANNWREKYEEQRATAQAALTHAQVQEQALADVKGRMQALQTTLTNAVTSLEQVNAELTREREQEAAERVTAEQRAQTATAVSKSLSETLSKLRETRDFLQSQLGTAHESRIRAEAQVLELTQQLNRAMAQSEQLNRIRRRQEETIQELRQDLQTVRARLQQSTVSATTAESGVGVGFGPGEPAEVPIRGQVTEIANGRVQLSVGSSSGVREGMEFNVIRGNQFLGSIVVTHVESTESVGRVSRSEGTIVEGDAVSTGFY